jgi:hypothetical protein
MPLNANFTRVDIQLVGGQQKLKVEGKSIPQTGADPIFVVMTHTGEAPKVGKVEQPGRAAWEVLFDEASAHPFVAGDLIFLVGLATRTDGAPEPFVWQGSFTI